MPSRSSAIRRRLRHGRLEDCPPPATNRTLRLERVLQCSVPPGPWGPADPRRRYLIVRHPVLADLCPRHQSPTRATQGDPRDRRRHSPKAGIRDHRPLRPGGIFCFSAAQTATVTLGHRAPRRHLRRRPMGLDRGDQYFAYDGWWHLDYDTVVTSGATPSMLRMAPIPRTCLAAGSATSTSGASAHAHPASTSARHQMIFGATDHDPSRRSFVGVVIDVEDLSSSVDVAPGGGAGRRARSSRSRRAGGRRRPCPGAPAVRGVPPFLSDIDLSVDDHGWAVLLGPGLKRYTTADPFSPRDRLGPPRRHRGPDPAPGGAGRRPGGGPRWSR